jgi:Fur family transcriptional regulator, ferric uptake regulator
VSVVVKRQSPSSPLPTAEDALAVFRERGGRITSSRRLLLQTLFDDPRERTAEELAEEIHRIAPDVNLSTIYRNLDDLEQLGVVVHAHLGHGPAVYGLAALAHGHLVCENCEAVIELPADLFDDLAGATRSRYGFDIHPHHFAILGRCRNCQMPDRAAQTQQSGRPSRTPVLPAAPVSAGPSASSKRPRRRR